MIQISEQWRFVAPHAEKTYWEDTIIQHAVTEHRAIRRTFSETVSRDEASVAAIIQQAREAAACIPSSLPRVYQMEFVDNRPSLIFENVDGRSFETLINQEFFKKPSAFLRFSLLLIAELIELRKTDARFENLSLQNVVLTDCEEIRINDRAVVSLRAGEDAESQLLQRLRLLPAAGVYTSAGAPNDSGEILLVKRTLLHMAAGTTKLDFQDWVSKPTPAEYGPEGRFSSLVLAIHRGQLPGLDQIHSRLVELSEEEANRRRQELNRTIAGGGFSAPSAEEIARSSGQPASPSKILRTGGASAPDAVPSTGAGGHDDNNPYAAGLAGVLHSAATPPARGESPAPSPGTKSPAIAALPEDENPYAANPLVSSALPTPQSGAAVRRDLPSGMMNPTKPRSGAPPVALIAGGAAALVVLIVIVVFASGVIGGGGDSGPNAPPVAAIAAPVKSTAVYTKIQLDAAASSDPEGKPLSYSWTLVDAKQGSASWSDPATGKNNANALIITRTPGVGIQFLEAGTYTISLVVNDGLLNSQPVSIQIEASSTAK